MEPFTDTPDTGAFATELRHLAETRTGTAELAIEELTCGTTHSAAWDKVVAAAPGASWSAYESPRYEWSGQLALHHPRTGLAYGECDADGNEILTADEARRRLGSVPIGAGHEALIAALFPTDAARRLIHTEEG